LVAEIDALTVAGAQVIAIVDVGKAADRCHVDLAMGALEESVANLSALASVRRGIVVNALVQFVSVAVAIPHASPEIGVVACSVKAVRRLEIGRTTAVPE
jgi:hypothetical protein